MNRTKGVLIAASLTGLVLVTILALGFGRALANLSGALAAPTSAPGSATPDTGQGDLQQQIVGWQQYSRQLEQTVQIMQARETQYQEQLASANQTIVQLQNEINSLNASQPRSFFGEREGHELGQFDD